MSYNTLNTITFPIAYGVWCESVVESSTCGTVEIGARTPTTFNIRNVINRNANVDWIAIGF